MTSLNALADAIIMHESTVIIWPVNSYMCMNMYVIAHAVQWSVSKLLKLLSHCKRCNSLVYLSTCMHTVSIMLIGIPFRENRFLPNCALWCLSNYCVDFRLKIASSILAPSAGSCHGNKWLMHSLSYICSFACMLRINSIRRHNLQISMRKYATPVSIPGVFQRR